MSKTITLQIPEHWRKGQFFFNFLEWCRTKGVDTDQNKRLADTFNIADDEFSDLLEAYQKHLARIKEINEE